jgi:thiamine-phosphate pyrophosphorylase
VSGPKGLKQVVETIPLPIIAIGGITAENVPEIMKAEAYGIAVISAVCCQIDPEGATLALREAMERSPR